MIDWSFAFTDLAGMLFKILYFVVVLGTIIVVILDNRNPLKTIAWLLVLIFVPFIGLIIYFFFGLDQRRERIISKKSYGNLLKKPMAQYLAQNSVPSPLAYNTLISLFKRTNQAFPYDGNDIVLLTNGYQKIQALIKELYKAKEHIHINYSSSSKM